MSKNKLILTGALLSLFALVGCKPTDEKAIALGQQAIADDMKDPTSVMFRKDKFVRTDHNDGRVTGFVCGELNAKNGFGAYVGYHSYVVELEMKPKDMFSKGVEYKILMKSLAPNEPHDLQRYKQVYREMCNSEAVAH
ncbi:TPA: hypothetical protein ACQ8HV_002974 [Escherichia coli]